ncbi:large ribosomal subunit protein mL40-like [Clytia hemisphaerica]|uniref:Large ribosomal subunit protein mL40 n=1 Tax=Clytia hemisphaerica TaxID=252671 RepID=A0A7M6DNB9_9CNID|eukprot:TCONS_00013744-protein
MLQSRIISSLSSCSNALQCCRTLHVSLVVNHNPGLKKKSKVAVDPKKLQRQKERQEAKLRKQVIQPPMDPDSIPDPLWFNEDRQRPKLQLSEEETEQRVLLQKNWSKYQMRKHVDDLRLMRNKLKCRNDALRELKKESEFLYNEALKVDKVNFPITLKGPMETPPLADYLPPDFVDEK